MTVTLPPVLDVPAAAELLRCAETTVEERARRGELPGLKMGEGWIFPTEALLLRLNELALEQATARRTPTSPTGRLVPLKGGGRAKRAPPVLPSA